MCLCGSVRKGQEKADTLIDDGQNFLYYYTKLGYTDWLDLPPSPTGWILKKVTDMEEGEAKEVYPHQAVWWSIPPKQKGGYFDQGYLGFSTHKAAFIEHIKRVLGYDPEQCYLIIRK